MRTGMITINSRKYWVRTDGIVEAVDQDRELSARIPCTLRELVDHFAECRFTIDGIWNLVEQHDGCQCYQDGSGFSYVVVGATFMSGWPHSGWVRSVNTRGCRCPGYRRVPLHEVLDTVKGDPKIVKQIREFVDNGGTTSSETEEMTDDPKEEIPQKETPFEKRKRLEEIIEAATNELAGLPEPRFKIDELHSADFDERDLIFGGIQLEFGRLKDFIAWLQSHVGEKS